MKQASSQNRRLFILTEVINKGHYPPKKELRDKVNEQSLIYDQKIGGQNGKVSEKTIQRDLAKLKEMGAPLYYCKTNGGYFFKETWKLPYFDLTADETFACLLTNKVTDGSLPTSIQEHLSQSMKIQLAAGEATKEAERALRTFIHATKQLVEPVSYEVSDKIIESWKSCQLIKAVYKRANNPENFVRVMEVHALFLSNDIWFAWAFCHKRKDFRTFSLHRFTKVELLEETFVRDLKQIEQVRSGNIFQHDMVKEIQLHCEPEIQTYISERTWFPDQNIELNEDGSLELFIPQAGEKIMLWWVASFRGAIQVVKPLNLRQKMKQAADLLSQRHS